MIYVVGVEVIDQVGKYTDDQQDGMKDQKQQKSPRDLAVQIIRLRYDQYQHGYQERHEACRQHFDKGNGIQRDPYPFSGLTVHELAGEMGGYVEKDRQEKELKIAPHLFTQVDRGSDLQKTQEADADAHRDEQAVDQIDR